MLRCKSSHMPTLERGVAGIRSIGSWVRSADRRWSCASSIWQLFSGRFRSAWPEPSGSLHYVGPLDGLPPGCGARPVKRLCHSASFHSDERIAPTVWVRMPPPNQSAGRIERPHRGARSAPPTNARRGLNDRTADCQFHAHAFALGRVESIEDLFEFSSGPAPESRTLTSTVFDLSFAVLTNKSRGP